MLTKSQKYLDAMMHIRKLQLLTVVPFHNTCVTRTAVLLTMLPISPNTINCLLLVT